MTDPVNLDAYLDAQRTYGEVESEERAFTLSRKHALSKMALFRDPFAHAWMVRLIQSAVALDPHQPVRVRLGRSEVQVLFEGRDLDLGMVERSFFDPEPSSEPWLTSLLAALWSVGAKDGWSFEVQAQDWECHLRWENNDLCRKIGPGSSGASCLIIRCAENSRTGANWAGKAVANSGQNIDLVRVLAERCYPCPAPLFVDGRRLDSLLNCPRHGWGFFAVPIGIRATEPELPKFALSASTLELTPFQAPISTARRQKGLVDCWEAEVARLVFPKLALPSEASLVFLLSIGKAPAYNRGSERDPRGESWRTVVHPSKITWIKDGTVLCEEPFGHRKLACSVAVFLSADGLQTDLTGFSLVESDAKRERVKLAIRQVAEQMDLDILAEFFQELELYHQKRMSRQNWFFSALGGVGAATVFSNPFLGLTALAGSTILHLTRSNPHTERKAWLSSALEEQKMDLLLYSSEL